MNEGIVEGGVDVRNTENELSLTDVLRSKRLLLLYLANLSFLTLNVRKQGDGENTVEGP